MKIKGIGEKIANLFIQIISNKAVGISVDTHCHRIPNRLKWVQTDSPGKTKEKLEEIFEQREWINVNGVLVGFGQLICKAKKPMCDVCPIVNLCISDENWKRREAQRAKNKVVLRYEQ